MVQENKDLGGVGKSIHNDDGGFTFIYISASEQVDQDGFKYKVETYKDEVLIEARFSDDLFFMNSDLRNLQDRYFNEIVLKEV